MTTSQYVRAVFDLDCEWQGLAPIYRVYIDDDLLTEREWRWSDHYLEEILQLEVPPGLYNIRLETLAPSLAKFTRSRPRIEHGNARWISADTLEVLPT